MTHHTAIYCRISQDRVGAGLGVERQEQDCRAVAAQLGSSVVAVRIDNDVSAYSGKKRPGYEQLLTDIASGQVDIVIAWHPDRLHRSPLELEHYIAVCDPRGVGTHTVKAGVLDLSTASGRMTARITGAVARHESEQRGERIARAKLQTKAAGKFGGGCRPFGFESDGVAHRLVEAEAIRTATRDILSGLSLRSTARRMNDTGLTTVRGGSWSGLKLRQVLLRSRNAGFIGKRTEIFGPACWEPIVDAESWHALVTLLDDPRRVTHHGTALKLIGSYLYFCECGKRVCSAGRRHDVERYRCPDNHVKRLAVPVDTIVLREVEAILAHHTTALIAPTADMAPLRERLGVLRAREKEIASLFGDPDSGMTAAQFRTSNEQLQTAIRVATAELNQLPGGSVLLGIADAAEPVAAFRDAPVERRRAVIETLVAVTLLRTHAGRYPDGSRFDPHAIRIEKKLPPRRRPRKPLRHKKRPGSPC